MRFIIIKILSAVTIFKRVLNDGNWSVWDTILLLYLIPTDVVQKSYPSRYVVYYSKSSCKCLSYLQQIGPVITYAQNISVCVFIFY